MISIDALRIKPIFYHSKEYKEVAQWRIKHLPTALLGVNEKELIYLAGYMDDTLAALLVFVPWREEYLVLHQLAVAPEYEHEGLIGTMILLASSSLPGSRWKRFYLQIDPKQSDAFKKAGFYVGTQKRTGGAVRAYKTIESPAIPLR